MTRNDRAPVVDTTGHSWDGSRSSTTRSPAGGSGSFYATIFWGLGYTILYPGLAAGVHGRPRACWAIPPAGTCGTRFAVVDQSAAG